MALTRMVGRLSTACPGTPECPHPDPHAGPHSTPCRPTTAYNAPNRAYGVEEAQDEAPPAARGPRWGKYAQADGELVADLMAELKEHLANLRAAGQDGRR